MTTENPLCALVSPARKGINREAVRAAAAKIEEKARKTEQSFTANLVLMFLAGIGAVSLLSFFVPGLIP